MANVGTGEVGKTLVGTGSGASPSYVDIGTNSGLTNHGVVIAQGNGAFVSSSAGANGQLLIGSNGANPAFAYLSSANGSITSTTGANSLDLSSAVGVVTSITGGPGITVTGTADVPIINSVVYTDQPIQITAASDSGSFMTNAGNIILDLPVRQPRVN